LIADFGIDPVDCYTICSIAHQFLTKKVYSLNKNLYQLSGLPALFVRQSVRGGRCMIAHNKKYDVKIILQDFDAVSLYPSAISRLWLVEGKPKPIHFQMGTTILNEIPSFLKEKSAYVLEIEIEKIGKHFAFPLLACQNEDTLDWTDDDERWKGKKLIVNDITLEDLIKYQNISFKIFKGYTWSGKKDYRVQEVIKGLFEKRRAYKAQGNTIQEIYKLVMNSAYGKTIQKEILTQTIFLPKEEALTHILRNHHIFKQAQFLGENVEKENSLVRIEEYKEISDQFSNPLFGSHILAMSKRIMCEVMCLGEELGCRMYYQDTDSMHIAEEDLQVLQQAYKEKFGRDLVSEKDDMGQFHNDFNGTFYPKIVNPTKNEKIDCQNKKKKVIHSRASKFCGKKAYIDVLALKDGSDDVMFRLKGVNDDAIFAQLSDPHAQDKIKEYKDLDETTVGSFDFVKYDEFVKKMVEELIALYDRLLHGKRIAFDLAARKPQFEFDKWSMEVRNIPERIREVMFAGDVLTIS
jgi:hypothetical protein